KMSFDPKVLMVDQLWLWVIDESECLLSIPPMWLIVHHLIHLENGTNYSDIIETVITCFPKPWSNQNPTADVVKRLKYYFRSKDREAVASVYDLVVLIL